MLRPFGTEVPQPQMEVLVPYENTNTYITCNNHQFATTTSLVVFNCHPTNQSSWLNEVGLMKTDTSRYIFSPAITSATIPANIATSQELTSLPMNFLQLVKCTRGTTAKLSCSDSTTWLTNSSLPTALSPMTAATTRAGARANPRVINRRIHGFNLNLKKPSITTWPARVAVTVALSPAKSKATAKMVLAAAAPSVGDKSW